MSTKFTPHYVHQGYQKAWGTKRGKNVFCNVFAKQENRWIRQNTRSIMMENGLHTPEWEAWLGVLEVKYADLWPKAVDQAHVLTSEEAHFLKTFTVAQLHRNPGRISRYEAAREIAQADGKPIFTLGRLIQIDAMPSGKRDVMVSSLAPDYHGNSPRRERDEHHSIFHRRSDRLYYWRRSGNHVERARWG